MSIALIPSGDEVKAIEIMAKNAVDSKYFDKLGGYAGIFSIAMYAREMNLPVMSSLFGGMMNVMGKITIAPQLMNAMIRKAGHKMDIDSNDTRCIIKGTRKDTGESCTVSFSVEEARKAGIYKAGGGWEKYPSDMCFARAMSRLARRLFPDVIGMSYVEGEIEDDKPKKEAKKEDSEPETIVVRSEFTVENPLDELKKRYSSYDPAMLDKYIVVCSIKKSVLPEVFAREALKSPDLIDKYYDAWLAKQQVKASEEAVTLETEKT